MNKSFFFWGLNKPVIALLLLALSAWSANAAPHAAQHPCSADAVKRAKKLLVLHAEPSLPFDVETTSAELPPLRNPANPKQRLDVLAVTGFVYKAEYRMRFIYAQMPGPCVLVGQEILEFTSL